MIQGLLAGAAGLSSLLGGAIGAGAAGNAKDKAGQVGYQNYTRTEDATYKNEGNIDVGYDRANNWVRPGATSGLGSLGQMEYYSGSGANYTGYEIRPFDTSRVKNKQQLKDQFKDWVKIEALGMEQAGDYQGAAEMRAFQTQMMPQINQGKVNKHNFATAIYPQITQYQTKYNTTNTQKKATATEAAQAQGPAYQAGQEGGQWGPGAATKNYGWEDFQKDFGMEGVSAKDLVRQMTSADFGRQMGLGENFDPSQWLKGYDVKAPEYQKFGREAPTYDKFAEAGPQYERFDKSAPVRKEVTWDDLQNDQAYQFNKSEMQKALGSQYGHLGSFLSSTGTRGQQKMASGMASQEYDKINARNLANYNADVGGWGTEAAQNVAQNAGRTSNWDTRRKGWEDSQTNALENYRIAAAQHEGAQKQIGDMWKMGADQYNQTADRGMSSYWKATDDYRNTQRGILGLADMAYNQFNTNKNSLFNILNSNATRGANAATNMANLQTGRAGALVDNTTQMTMLQNANNWNRFNAWSGANSAQAEQYGGMIGGGLFGLAGLGNMFTPVGNGGGAVGGNSTGTFGK